MIMWMHTDACKGGSVAAHFSNRSGELSYSGELRIKQGNQDQDDKD